MKKDRGPALLDPGTTVEELLFELTSRIPAAPKFREPQGFVVTSPSASFRGVRDANRFASRGQSKLWPRNNNEFARFLAVPGDYIPCFFQGKSRDAPKRRDIKKDEMQNEDPESKRDERDEYADGK